jgi:hypothetical protein
VVGSWVWGAACWWGWLAAGVVLALAVVSGGLGAAVRVIARGLARCAVPAGLRPAT